MGEAQPRVTYSSRNPSARPIRSVRSRLCCPTAPRRFGVLSSESCSRSNMSTQSEWRRVCIACEFPPLSKLLNRFESGWYCCAFFHERVHAVNLRLARRRIKGFQDFTDSSTSGCRRAQNRRQAVAQQLRAPAAQKAMVLRPRGMPVAEQQHDVAFVAHQP